ncbi:hypothetical protein DID88_001838 [Monilinia fructigena]|uniref:Uncharacterized protein n=1 Tax=Monilinia fructigena TaxID=38457 RepID=A0A395IVS3_9HELO|nr:hypothetical protein DID88_001838 [Monilinia fructigena]
MLGSQPLLKNFLVQVFLVPHVSSNSRKQLQALTGLRIPFWLTAEKEIPSDLDWHFGFTIPRNATDTGKSETPVPGPERRPKPVHDPKDGPVPTEEDKKKKEELLLAKAKTFGASDKAEDLKIRGAIEAWNLADTEAWRFARAFLARSRVERLKWEEEEKKYAGGAGLKGARRMDGKMV